MDIESIERCWREEAFVLPPLLEEGTVRQMIETRASDLRRAVRGRLRREAGYYLPIMVISMTGLLAGFSLNRLLASLVVVVLLAVVMAALRLAERRIDDAPVDGSLKEVLSRLASQVEAAGRIYVAVYVAVFVGTALVLTAIVWLHHGAGWPLAATLAGSVLAVLWSHQSGNRYVRGMFRRYRAELADCLRQLEGQA
jgi:hypothetical protein